MKNKILRYAAQIIIVVSLVPLISFASSYFYVGTNGDLGIGTDNPLAPLDVAGAIYSRLVNDTDAASTTVDWNNGNVQ